jgi:hypothetical protein
MNLLSSRLVSLLLIFVLLTVLIFFDVLTLFTVTPPYEESNNVLNPPSPALERKRQPVPKATNTSSRRLKEVEPIGYDSLGLNPNFSRRRTIQHRKVNSTTGLFLPPPRSKSELDSSGQCTRFQDLFHSNLGRE